MKRTSAVFFSTGLAAAMLFGVASNSVAGGGPPPVFSGEARFPDHVFVIAEHSGAGQAACQSNSSTDNLSKSDVANMSVEFETRTSGLALVRFCGTLDVSTYTSKVGMRAVIDGQTDRCHTSYGDNEWSTYNTADGNAANANDGPICLQWICEVENDPCGKSPNSTCWTDHEIKVQCGYGPSSGYAQFNDRSLDVAYTRNHSN